MPVPVGGVGVEVHAEDAPADAPALTVSTISIGGASTAPAVQLRGDQHVAFTQVVDGALKLVVRWATLLTCSAKTFVQPAALRSLC